MENPDVFLYFGPATTMMEVKKEFTVHLLFKAFYRNLTGLNRNKNRYIYEC